MKKLYLLTLVALGITADLAEARGGSRGGGHGGHGGGGHWGGGRGGWGHGGWNRGGWGRGWYGGYGLGLGWGWPYYGGGYYPYYNDGYNDDVVYVDSTPSYTPNVVLMDCDSNADCGTDRGLEAGKWYCDTSVNYCKRISQTQALQRQAQAPTMAAQANDDVDASDVDMK